MPKIRDQVVRRLTDPNEPLRTLTNKRAPLTQAEHEAGLDLTANHLRASGLYWVTADMSALAISAGASLDAARWSTADRPQGCGLLIWDGGIGNYSYAGVDIPVEACSWGPAPDGCGIGLWVTRSRAEVALSASGRMFAGDLVPPLIPIVAFTLPVTSEPVPMAEVPPGVPVPTLRALAAAWLLMEQPNLVERTIERPDKSVRRAYGRSGRENPEVTVIDLRHQYVPADQDESDDSPSRRYNVRWVVSGHWRNQAHGPDQSLRRRQWIPSYTKGPDGAPLLITEKVNVWRR